MRRQAARTGTLPTGIKIAIVGGGVAGCATALGLLRHGRRDFIVLEAEPDCRFHIGETMPPAGATVLRRFGLWEAFLAQGHVPSPGSAASWGKEALGYNDFLFEPQGRGWHLDRARFDRLLAGAVTARGSALARGLRLREVVARPGGFTLIFDAAGGTQKLDAEFLVDATGIAAAAVRRLGVARNAVDCLMAVYGLFDLATPGEVPARTLLEAADYGWWYAAALPGARLIAALTTDRAGLRSNRLSEPAAWDAALRQTRYLAPLLARGGARGIPKLAVAIAPSAILSRVTGPRWLAVGDAAASYDPLTSQGIVKALLDGEAAGAAIAAHLDGEPKALPAYQDRLFAGFTHYLALRRYFYGLERRWPQAPFWRRPLTGQMQAAE